MKDFSDYGPYFDYPSKPIGGNNPYYQCVCCGASEPQINGTLSGHFKGCSYVKDKIKKLKCNIEKLIEKSRKQLNELESIADAT